SDQEHAPLFPWLGHPIADLENRDAVLLVGANVREEQPIAAHRLRKAALAGAKVMAVNARDCDFRFPLAVHVVREPLRMVHAVAAVAKAAIEAGGATMPASISALLGDVQAGDAEHAIAANLREAGRGSVLLGEVSTSHPGFATLRALAHVIAEQCGAQFGYLPEAVNTAGAWLAGVVPHRGPAGAPVKFDGIDAKAMLETPRKAYLLFGVEPEVDCEDPATALQAMNAAQFVVSCSPFASQSAREYADVLLPIASFAETSGTFVNAEGRWQSFNGAAALPGESRPGWKVLRVLGNAFGVDGFDYMASIEVRDELKARCAKLEFDNSLAPDGTNELSLPPLPQGVVHFSSAPVYAVDSVVRRAEPLQQTVHAPLVAAYMNPGQAKALGLDETDKVTIHRNGSQATLPLVIDEGMPMDCVWTPAGVESVPGLTGGWGPVELSKA
ncbi:MAG: molybdopterin-dependent oxidoreductase, partial [Gammaproteobacteria bacterium]